MTLNLRDIREYVDGGWIREQVHPDFPELSIFNYTQVTQYEQKWDDITKSCRSFDKRPDTEVKKDIYDKYLKGYNVVKVYDDRPSVIRMWQVEGLEVIDCGGGVEF